MKKKKTISLPAGTLQQLQAYIALKIKEKKNDLRIYARHKK